MSETHEYRTADGVTVKTGDKVFSHYTMTEGTIGEAVWGGSGKDWFRFDQADGSWDSLDGSRICSLDHARRMGWLK